MSERYLLKKGFSSEGPGAKDCWAYSPHGRLTQGSRVGRQLEREGTSIEQECQEVKDVAWHVLWLKGNPGTFPGILDDQVRRFIKMEGRPSVAT